jgi:hypothetical protein
MTDCAAVQPLLLDRAAGILLPSSGRELDDHLAGCAACRVEAAAYEETLGLVRLPPAGADELGALGGLAAELLRRRQASRTRAAGWKRAGAGVAVAASLLAALALPAFWRTAPTLGEAERAALAQSAGTAQSGQEAWTPPDPDELLATAALIWPDAEVGGATRSTLGEEEVLLGAAEEWSELFPAVE